MVDFATWFLAMQMGLGEANPIISWLGANIWSVMAYKIVLTAGVVILLIRLKKFHLFKWLNIGMAGVVVWGLVWLLI